MYIHKLDDIVNKYNNKYHKSIKVKLVGVKSSKYIELIKKIITKVQVGDHVGISKNNFFFAKGSN